MADTRLSRIEQKIAQLEAKRSVARQRLQNEERRKRTRQAMLIGQFVVGQCQKPGDDREKFGRLVRYIAKSLDRQRDREILLLLLSGASESPPANEVAAQTCTP